MKDKSMSAVEVYDRIANEYAEFTFGNIHNKNSIDDFLDLLPNGARILDIGCGSGKYTKYFIERGYLAEGIDLSKEMVRIARHKVPEAVFKVMDLRNLEYPDASFNGLFAAFSLIHVPEQEVIPALREFSRVLKLRGALFVSVYQGEGEGFVEEPVVRGGKTFTKFFTQEELKQDLKKTNFSVLKTSKETINVEGTLGSDKLIMIAQKS